jgi:hypothetical protein
VQVFPFSQDIHDFYQSDISINAYDAISCFSYIEGCSALRMGKRCHQCFHSARTEENISGYFQVFAPVSIAGHQVSILRKRFRIPGHKQADQARQMPDGA